MHLIAAIFCRTMLCIRAACPVARCPSVCLSVCPCVAFVYSVETIEHTFTFFHRVVATQFWLVDTKRYGNIPRGIRNEGAKCSCGRQKIMILGQYLASSRVVNGPTATCYTHSRARLASWRHSSLIAISGVVCCSRRLTTKCLLPRYAKCNRTEFNCTQW